METSLKLILQILKAVKVLLWPNILFLHGIVYYFVLCSKCYLYNIYVKIQDMCVDLCKSVLNGEVHVR